VYFSAHGPATFEVGTKDYEDNLIANCFGPHRLEEYRGSGLLDLCLVYGMVPTVLSQAPGGRDNCKMVGKALFHSLALPAADGNFFLRPDRILAAFLLPTTKPLRGCIEASQALAAQRAADEATEDRLGISGQRMGANSNKLRDISAELHRKVAVEDADLTQVYSGSGDVDDWQENHFQHANLLVGRKRTRKLQVDLARQHSLQQENEVMPPHNLTSGWSSSLHWRNRASSAQDAHEFSIEGIEVRHHRLPSAGVAIEDAALQTTFDESSDPQDPKQHEERRSEHILRQSESFRTPKNGYERRTDSNAF
jgi:hypothetical protein